MMMMMLCAPCAPTLYPPMKNGTKQKKKYTTHSTYTLTNCQMNSDVVNIEFSGDVKVCCRCANKSLTFATKQMAKKKSNQSN